MAAWEAEALLSHPVDFRLVHNTFVTMFWNPAVLRETTTWLADHRYHVVTVDTSGWADARDMHRDLALALNFPDYYGRNLDAVNDCMRDVAAGDYGVRTDATGLVLAAQLREVRSHTERFGPSPAGHIRWPGAQCSIDRTPHDVPPAVQRRQAQLRTCGSNGGDVERRGMARRKARPKISQLTAVSAWHSRTQRGMRGCQR